MTTVQTKGTPDPERDNVLATAYAALDAGRIDHARELAQSVFAQARSGDPRTEAQALSCLAHCDRVGSRLRRASEAARRAAQLFEQLADTHGEIQALITLTHSTMLLGRNDEAVEAALLCTRLCDTTVPQPLTVIAYNCLGLACCWGGDHDRADAALETAVQAARRCVPAVSVYQPRLNQVWVEASRLIDERYQTGAMKSLGRAWAKGDWPATERQLTEMRGMALAVEHEQLAGMAHLLLGQVYELQGKHADARRAYRALRQRERRVMAEVLGSRESLVSWRIGARQSERHLEQALAASKQFERWSLEDALSGIANRRHFEQSLALRLPAPIAADRPLRIAMVDVDKFKVVNDRFTHLVGDRVLKTIAAIVASEVREHDLPARWANDEFVILFDGANEPEARGICDRIRIAVVGFDWHAIAPGLQMSVSIGSSEVLPGDTAQSVLQRSDESMYRTKSVEPAPIT